MDHLNADPSAPPTPAQSPSRSPSTHSDSTPLRQNASSSTSQIPTEQTSLLPAEILQYGHRPVPTPNAPHYLTSIVTDSPRYLRSSENFYIINDMKYHLKHGDYHMLEQGRCVCVTVCPGNAGCENSLTTVPETERGRSQTRGKDPQLNDEEARPRVGRKRQVVGILVRRLTFFLVSPNILLPRFFNSE